jgi:hypothetical protein
VCRRQDCTAQHVLKTGKTYLKRVKYGGLDRGYNEFSSSGMVNQLLVH